MNRLSYYRRILASYFLTNTNQLTFWHDRPEVHEDAFQEKSDAYFMRFDQKADYSGPTDPDGVPMLDYHGRIGRQYNPIAIAQYGLGNFNRWRRSGNNDRRRKFLNIGEWLADHLESNVNGLKVWHHHFDWEYFKTLRAPWYSALAQGQGISLLVRCYRVTQDERYLTAAQAAFQPMVTPVSEGGVLFVDDQENWWLEEYIVSPPTHILNGFIWALWGVYDYMAITADPKATELWAQSLRTLRENLGRFDAGYWSLYDLSPTRLKNLASWFYHRLHMVQLNILHRLTGIELFRDTSLRWTRYEQTPLNTYRALLGKSVFKLVYF